MRILVVEDEQNLAKSLKKTLETEGYAVDTAFSGDDAYEIAFGDEYDLILLDLGLPGMSGLQLAAELRNEMVETPILMLTARDTVKDKVSGFTVGADDYLVKPFEFDELLARIRAVLKRPKMLLPSDLEVGSLVLNVQTKLVQRAGKNVQLTAKEFTLLEYFMRNKGHILSKQHILDHVWDKDLDPFSNIVDVYIGYLRSKIDTAFPTELPLLKTIKGMGYKLG